MTNKKLIIISTGSTGRWAHNLSSFLYIGVYGKEIKDNPMVYDKVICAARGQQ